MVTVILGLELEVGQIGVGEAREGANWAYGWV